jgi:hypothetical protein
MNSLWLGTIALILFFGFIKQHNLCLEIREKIHQPEFFDSLCEERHWGVWLSNLHGEKVCELSNRMQYYTLRCGITQFRIFL